MNPITEKHKLYFLLTMVVVAGIVGYFRFLRSPGETKKENPTSEITHPKDQKLSSKMMQTPTMYIEIKTEKPTRKQLTRNIFKPSGSLPVLPPAQQRPGVNTPTVEMKLSGTLIGVDAPMAIINNQFVTQNQTIGNYRVTRITPDRVYLTSGKDKICLKVLSLAQAITPNTPARHDKK